MIGGVYVCLYVCMLNVGLCVPIWFAMMCCNAFGAINLYMCSRTCLCIVFIKLFWMCVQYACVESLLIWILACVIAGMFEFGCVRAYQIARAFTC